jgi:tight adherence protein C
MSLLGFTIIIGVLVFAGLCGVIYALSGRQTGLKRRLGATKPDDSGHSSWRNLLKGSQRVFKPLGDMIPRSPEEMSRQQKRLVMAGIRHKDGPVLFYGVKIGLAITLLVVFSAMGMIKWNPLLAVSLPVLLGALIPDVWLTRKSRNRKERIQLAIPDVLDLTVVCVEAGLGLDQALMRIGQELRTSHRDLSAVLIQTDRFGTSIAQSLRVFSESLRTKRRQRAEERAAKTTVKMVPVLVFFIFPSVFIVVLFPAVLAIIRDLFPAIGGK